MDIMGRTLEEGEYPKQQDEIALDAYTISNLQVEKKLGTQVTLGEKTYTLCGIVKSRPANSGEEMMAFVSEDTPDETGETRLYLRFDERKKVYKDHTRCICSYHQDRAPASRRKIYLYPVLNFER